MNHCRLRVWVVTGVKLDCVRYSPVPVQGTAENNSPAAVLFTHSCQADADIPATSTDLLNGPPGDSADCVSWPPHSLHRGAYCHNQMTIACTIVRRFAYGDFRVFNRPAFPDACFRQTDCDSRREDEPGVITPVSAFSQSDEFWSGRESAQSLPFIPNYAARITGLQRFAETIGILVRLPDWFDERRR